MPANRNNISWHLHNMIAAPTGIAAVKTIFKSKDGIMLAYGITVPSDAATGYAEGCLFFHTDGTAGSDTLYTNDGTNESADFNVVLNRDNVVTQIQADYLASSADDGGGSPLLWDGAPLLEVMLDPSKGYYYFNDFFQGIYTGTDGIGLWQVTKRTTGSAAHLATEQGGVVTIDAGAATAGQGVTCQLPRIVVKPEPGTTIRIEWRMKCDEDAGRIAMGLGAVGTTDWISDDTMETTSADHAMFFRDSGTVATKWSGSISDGGTGQAVDDILSGADAGYETYGIKIVGSGTLSTDTVTFYRNGVAATTALWTTDIGDMPDGVMVPTFESNADGTDQPVIKLDWLRILVSNSTDGSRA